MLKISNLNAKQNFKSKLTVLKLRNYQQTGITAKTKQEIWPPCEKKR